MRTAIDIDDELLAGAVKLACPPHRSAGCIVTADPRSSPRRSAG